MDSQHQYPTNDIFTSGSDYNLDSAKMPSNRITFESTKVSTGKALNSHNSYKPTLNSGIPTDYKTFRTSSDNPLSVNNIPTNQSIGSFTQNRNYSAKNISRISSASQFQDNVRQLEVMINDIKLNGFNRIKAEVEEKMKIRNILENNVNSLENTLKILRSHNKCSDVSSSKLLKEKDVLMLTGEKAHRELYFISKEIPELKSEIDSMNDVISLKNEELRYIRNDAVEMDKEIMVLKEEIKKVNKCNSDIKKEKENLRNGIGLLKRHICSLSEKIEKQETQCKEFLNDVSVLLNQSCYGGSNRQGR